MEHTARLASSYSQFRSAAPLVPPHKRNRYPPTMSPKGRGTEESGIQKKTTTTAPCPEDPIDLR